MKKTTQKILLLLYSQKKDQSPRLRLNQLDWLLPDLTPAGVRSLVYLLKHDGLIEVDKLDGVDYLNLTYKGKEALEAHFKALRPFWDQWTGQWSEAVFLKPPAGDRQFRYLRQLLLTEGALPLSRGVYLWPTGFLVKLRATLERLYIDSILVVKLAEMDFGDISPIVKKYYLLNELYNNYSSISRELKQLLSEVKVKKGLMKKERQRFLNLLERIQFNLESDLGILSYYYPDVTRVNELVKQCQVIVKILMIY